MDGRIDIIQTWADGRDRLKVMMRKHADIFVVENKDDTIVRSWQGDGYRARMVYHNSEKVIDHVKMS